MPETPTAYPLAWPAGWPRTTPRQKGQYRTQLSGALKNLRDEIRLLCGDVASRTLLLSSNVTLGADRPADPGVVAYFSWDKQQIAIPCDRWQNVEHNVQAIALTIEAMRAMDRHGAKHMIRAMFQGFTAIRGPGPKPWREVLGFPADSRPTREQIRAKRNEMAKLHHSDAGGDDSRMAEINVAVDQALGEMG
jgi:hypothetical protein